MSGARQRGLRPAFVGAGAAAFALALACCQIAAPDPPAIQPHGGDLLYRGREWRQAGGLVQARDRLAGELAKIDASGGSYERRVARANQDPDFVFPDSLAAKSPAWRSKTGVYLVLGFRQNTGEAAAALRYIAASMRKDGWHAHVVPINEWGSPRDHAGSIERYLREDLRKVDRAVMVGFSMGATSWVRWMSEHAPKWPAAERSKFQLGIFFAGSLRGAAFAKWAAEGRSIEAAFVRWKLRSLDGGTGEALGSIRSAAVDPWATERIPSLERMLPGFTVLEYVTLPDGTEGLPERFPMLRDVSRPIARDMPWIGPFDGMVETGAQVLPPGDSTPQWIMRIFGSHAITEGFYQNGGDVSWNWGRKDGERGRAGVDMVSDLLRALPARLAE